MKVCPKCQQENDDEADFCSKCREYLRWERTGYMPAVAAPASPPAPAAPSAGGTPPAAAPPPRPSASAPPVPAPAAPPPPPAPEPPREGGVVVTLRIPGLEASGDAHARTKVDPGSQAAIQALVRNQSGVVDNYSLRVEGIPETWWTVDTPMVYLVPFGSGGGNYEQEVTIRLHPPRSPEAEARDWPIRVVAVSHAQSGHVAGGAAGTVTVTQFYDLELEVAPQISSGRRSGAFAVAVRNRGNGAVAAQLAGKDDEGACTFLFEQPAVQIRRGERVSTAVHVRPPKQIWVGRQQDRRVELTATPVGTETVVHPRQAIFRQRAWLPKWVLLIIPLLIAMLIAFIMTRPKQVKKTVVPDIPALLAAQNVPALEQVFQARAIVETAHLKLSKEYQYLPAAKDSDGGKVLKQIPLPGTKVPYGTEVVLEVAQAKGVVKVPNIAGLTVPNAIKKLGKFGLPFGKADPDDPTLFPTIPILFSNPAAGTEVPKGTPIDVTLKVSKPTESGATTGAAGGGGGPAPAGAAAVPALALGSVLIAAASDKITKAGLTAEPHIVISDKKPGTVVRMTPAAGAKPPDGIVKVFYSGGYPSYAFQANQQIFVADSLDGASAKGITGKSFFAEGPAWSPDGKVLYYSGGNDGKNAWIYMQDTETAGAKPKAVTDGKTHFDSGPAISPDGKTLAFVRSPSADKRGDESELCLTPLGGTPSVSCVTFSGHVVFNPIWSPNGKLIIVRGRAGSDPSVDLYAFTSPQANGADQGLWSAPTKSLTAKLHSGRDAQVLSASFAPAGAGALRLAVAANWGEDGVYRISTVNLKSSGGVSGKPASIGVTGCAVDWRRPDAGELLIVQDATKGCLGSGSITVIRRDPKGASQTLSTKAPVAAVAWQPLGDAAASGG